MPANDHDEEPPEMEEPPDEVPFKPVPPPPVGSTPLLQLILSTVSDPDQRRAIQEAVWALSDGDRGDHMLTQAAALLSAVENAHLDRMLVVLDEFREVEEELRLLIRVQQRGGYTQPQAVASASLTSEQLREFGQSLGDAIVEGQEAKFTAIQQAAKTALNQRTVAFFVAAFFAGLALALILVLIFHS